MNLKKICLLPGDTDLANVDLIYVQEGGGKKKKTTNTPRFRDTNSVVELQVTQRSRQNKWYGFLRMK